MDFNEFLNIHFPDEMIRAFLNDKKHEIRVPISLAPMTQKGKTFAVREACAIGENGQLIYAADGTPVPEGIPQWNNPSYMPKKAVRIVLVYETGWFEPLQNITVDGVLKEGLDVPVPPICQDRPFTKEELQKLDKMSDEQRNEYFHTLAKHRYMGWCCYRDDLFRKFRNAWDSYAKENIPGVIWAKNPVVGVMTVSIRLAMAPEKE